MTPSEFMHAVKLHVNIPIRFLEVSVPHGVAETCIAILQLCNACKIIEAGGILAAGAMTLKDCVVNTACIP